MPKPSEGIPAYPDCELVPATAEKHELQSRVRSELQRIGFSGAYTFMQCYPAYWILETIDEAQYHDLSNPGGWVRKQVRERFTNYLCNWMRDDVY